MAKRTGPTNRHLRKLIETLRVKSRELEAPIWEDVAEKLNSPTRRKVEVNLSEIDRHANEGETVIIPGKVLASGDLTKKVNIAAWQFSVLAKTKIEKAKGKIMGIDELLEKNPKGSNVKILV